MARISAYVETQAKQKVETLIDGHLHLVKKIAYHLICRLPSSVQIDDLIQTGLMGLIEASNRFDETKMASFTTFASIRIRGAMLDELRKSSWIPRSVQQNMKLISKAIATVENRTGKPATPVEIAEEMDIDIEEYHLMMRGATATELVDIEKISDSQLKEKPQFVDPFEKVERGDLLKFISKIIKAFPEKEQMVLSLYYQEELNFKQIGEVMNLTEARICQLHNQAIARLKTKVKATR